MDKRIYHETFKLEKDYWWHVSKRRLVQQVIRKSVNGNKDVRILDAGCGTGIMMSELSNYFPNVYGLDKSPLALAFCRKRGLRDVHHGNLERRLPFKDGTFDVVICLDVIEHLNHDGLALKEFRRILKPKGLVIISVPAYQFLWTKHDEILWHKRRYRRGQLIKLIQSVGFKIVKASYFYSFLILPALLLFKLKLMFHGGKSKSVVIPAKPINWLLLKICAVERQIINQFSLPTGISILAVAQK